jgi:hypothetical protein
MSTFAAQVPTGSVNGSNKTFRVTLNTSSLTGVEFYKNGLLQESGVDYTLTQALGTATIITSTPPASGDTINSWLWQE